MKKKILGFRPFRFVFFVIFIVMGIIILLLPENKPLAIFPFLMAFYALSKQGTEDKIDRYFH